MKHLIPTLTLTALLAVTLLMIIPTAHAQVSATIGEYTVEFQGISYNDPQQEASTWFYCVDVPSTAKDLGHLTFGVPATASILDAGTWDGVDKHDRNPGDGTPEVGTDPTTKVSGVKFDEEVGSGLTQCYYYTIDYNAVVDAVEVGTKSKKAVTSTMDGPGEGSAFKRSRLNEEAEVAAGVPTAYGLEGNYPNPFNPQTTIRFDVPESAFVKLVVYDVRGRQVRVLVDGTRTAGTHEVVFNAGDLPSGTYLVRFVTPQHSFVQTVQLVK